MQVAAPLTGKGPGKIMEGRQFSVSITPPPVPKPLKLVVPGAGLRNDCGSGHRHPGGHPVNGSQPCSSSLHSHEQVFPLHGFGAELDEDDDEELELELELEGKLLDEEELDEEELDGKELEDEELDDGNGLDIDQSLSL